MTVLKYGDRILSPGSSYIYEVIGPVCRLYDREQLHYPHCRIEWKDCRGGGKAPSWRRQGKRFVADLAAKRYPSYAVVILGSKDIVYLTLFWVDQLNEKEQDWWFSKTPYLRDLSQGQETVVAA